MQRVSIFFLCLVLILVSVIHFPAYGATLLNGTDYVTSIQQGDPLVNHSISFRISDIGGHTLLTSEYIRIVFNDYTAVTPATSGSGWGGAPIFTSSGNSALITNVSAGPSDLIKIGGITATNPSTSDFSITIQLASDSLGTIVYDSAIIQPTLMSSSVTTSVSISYENSQVSLTGMTSPGALVTIMFNGVIVATELADSNGNFTRLIGPLFQNTLYDVEIYATDIDGRVSDPVSLAVTTIPHSTINLSNILLLPTIELIPVNVTQGDLLLVIGRAHPGSTIILYLDDGSLSTVTAAADGSWSYQYSTAATSLGIHHFTVRELTVGAILSPFTNRRYFQVLQPATNPGGGGGTGTTGGTGGSSGGSTNNPPGDATPPIINIVIPVDGGTLSGEDNTVVIEIIEDNGIDLGSLIIIIGGIEYTIDNPDLSITTENGRIIVSIIVDTSLFVDGRSYRIEVSVDDLSGNSANSSSRFTFVKKSSTGNDNQSSAGRESLFLRVIRFIGDVIGEFSDTFKVELAVIATALLLLLGTLLLSNGWAYLGLMILLLFFPRSKKKGLILDSDTSPVPLMKILLVGAVTNKVISKSLSDFNGRYSFDALAGDYLLRFNDPLHIEKSVNINHQIDGELGIKVIVEKDQSNSHKLYRSFIVLRNKILKQFPLILFMILVLAILSFIGFIQ